MVSMFRVLQAVFQFVERRVIMRSTRELASFFQRPLAPGRALSRARVNGERRACVGGRVRLAVAIAR